MREPLRLSILLTIANIQILSIHYGPVPERPSIDALRPFLGDLNAPAVSIQPPGPAALVSGEGRSLDGWDGQRLNAAFLVRILGKLVEFN